MTYFANISKDKGFEWDKNKQRTQLLQINKIKDSSNNFAKKKYDK